jgi:hypothetical protein
VIAFVADRSVCSVTFTSLISLFLALRSYTQVEPGEVSSAGNNPATRPHRRLVSAALPIATGAAIFVLALTSPKITEKSTSWIFGPGFSTESVIRLCSLAPSDWLTKGHFADFRFTRGSFRFTPRFFLWLLPMLAVATLLGYWLARRCVAERYQPGADEIAYRSNPHRLDLRKPLRGDIHPSAAAELALSAGGVRIHLLRSWALRAPTLLSAFFRRDACCMVA